MTPRRVFVVCNRHRGIRKASNYGELVFLSWREMPKFRVEEMYQRFYPILLTQSHPEDYILLSGLSVMTSVACSIFSVLHHRLNLLIHDNTTKQYLVRRITLNENYRVTE